MTELELLAAGVVASGFGGDAFDEALPALGGYVLFARNCPSLPVVRALTDALRRRRIGDAEPLVAIDQEGGRVLRLRDGVEPMPSMMALGATGDAELARRAGEQTAFDLRRAGCTMNLAPVLDLALNAGNTVIGTRSLGSDPQRVAELGAAYAEGLSRGGVLACFKHFPGHGATAIDSHVALPVIETDAQTLRARDLLPFAAVARGAAAVMSAHVVASAFDRRPASLSPAVGDGLLRRELGFDGALLSDCLQMGAVGSGNGSVPAGVDALRAGTDLLLVSDDVETARALVRAIAAAVRSGSLPRPRLEEAYERVLRLRRSGAAPLALDGFPPHPGVGREIARRAITVVRGVPHADPVACCAVDFGPDETRPDLTHEAPAIVHLPCPIDGGDQTALLARIAETERRPIVLMRRAHLHAAQAAGVARILEAYPDAAVVSMLEPYDLPVALRARHLLAAYGDDRASLGGLADVLFGGSRPEGRLPVTVGLGV
ncbi:MAG TPA: beta-N-acetylhexosaminidase [Candidatus Acidoferrales bacterium]|nr:beta-N-acetylhexosaminidase [Candidatus Acidoferrales bacterium]